MTITCDKREKRNHNNFSMIPRIIHRIGLTGNEKSLYLAIKDSCGEHGVCTKSLKSLAELGGISERSVKNLLKKLSEKNQFLKKPLIEIKKRKTECGDRDTNYIIVVDIWKDNEEYFKKQIGEATIAPPQATIAPGVRQPLPQGQATIAYKQEPINKNPYKKTTTQTLQAEKPNIKRSEPAAPVVVVFSCLKKITDESVTERHKAEISEKYRDNEQLVIDAVATVTHSDFIPEESLIKSLRAACKGEWKPSQGKKDKIKEKEDFINKNKQECVKIYESLPEFLKVKIKINETHYRINTTPIGFADENCMKILNQWVSNQRC